MAQATSQFGRGAEEILIVEDMYQGSVEQGAPADHGIIIDADAMLGDIFVPPEPFISDRDRRCYRHHRHESIEVRQGGEIRISLDTVDMLEGQLVQPEPRALIRDRRYLSIP